MTSLTKIISDSAVRLEQTVDEISQSILDEIEQLADNVTITQEDFILALETLIILSGGDKAAFCRTAGLDLAVIKQLLQGDTELFTNGAAYRKSVLTLALVAIKQFDPPTVAQLGAALWAGKSTDDVGENDADVIPWDTPITSLPGYETLDKNAKAGITRSCYALLGQIAVLENIESMPGAGRVVAEDLRVWLEGLGVALGESTQDAQLYKNTNQASEVRRAREFMCNPFDLDTDRTVLSLSPMQAAKLQDELKTDDISGQIYLHDFVGYSRDEVASFLSGDDELMTVVEAKLKKFDLEFGVELPEAYKSHQWVR